MKYKIIKIAFFYYSFLIPFINYMLFKFIHFRDKIYKSYRESINIVLKILLILY